MRFFRDESLLRRAVGAALLFGLIGLAGQRWAVRLDAAPTVNTDSYEAATGIQQVFWGLAVAAVVYVAVCLLLTPRER